MEAGTVRPDRFRRKRERGNDMEYADDSSDPHACLVGYETTLQCEASGWQGLFVKLESEVDG